MEELAGLEGAARERAVAANEAMAEASGQFQTSDPLVVLLYLLARDDLPVGQLDSQVDDALLREDVQCWSLTNGWLAQWAQYTAGRLRPPPA